MKHSCLRRLVSLHGSLKKLLPVEYVEMEQSPDVQMEPIDSIRKRSGVEFNGVRVSLPQYRRLKELQDKVIKLDTVMRRLSEEVDPRTLGTSEKWNKLLSMRQSLQRLLPDEHPHFDKRSASMEFNGVQVSCNLFPGLIAAFSSQFSTYL